MKKHHQKPDNRNAKASPVPDPKEKLLSDIYVHACALADLAEQARQHPTAYLCNNVQSKIRELRVLLRNCREQNIAVEEISTLDLHRYSQEIRAIRKRISEESEEGFLPEDSVSREDSEALVPDTVDSNAYVAESRRQRGAFLAVISAVLITLMLAAVFGAVYYLQTHASIPFNSEDVIGDSADSVSRSLEEAGFTNIRKEVDFSGWQEGGQVLSVTIDSSDTFLQGTYQKKDAPVVVTYTSEDRIYVTDLLSGWSDSDYTDIVTILEGSGFTSVTAVPEITQKPEQDQHIAEISLGGIPYTDEECYLPADTPIEMTYYTLKVSVGSDYADFIGRSCEEVTAELEQKGFTNVLTEAVSDGWEQGGSILSLTVDGSVDYDPDEILDPDTPVVIRYSSDDRIDAGSLLAFWQSAKYGSIVDSLEEAGFTDVRVGSVPTQDASRDQRIREITIDDIPYDDEPCFVQSDLTIRIMYFSFMPTAGISSSSCRNKPYEDIADLFAEQGFTNIRIVRADDMSRFSLFTKEGTVRSVTIDGSDWFDQDDTFAVDSEVVISVHSYPGEGLDEITDVLE